MIVLEEPDPPVTAIKIYVNGQLHVQDVRIEFVGDISGGLGWTFGQEWDGSPTAGDKKNGRLDEVKIFNGAMSAVEVHDLFVGQPFFVTTTADVIDITEELVSGPGTEVPGQIDVPGRGGLDTLTDPSGRKPSSPNQRLEPRILHSPSLLPIVLVIAFGCSSSGERERPISPLRNEFRATDGSRGDILVRCGRLLS